MIAIVDYGIGNVGSIRNMLTRLGVDSVITPNPELILSADHIILPGVGSFDLAMENIEKLSLREILDKVVQVKGKPILGICLGMQLLTNGSEEGDREGFGWIDAMTRRFNFEADREELPIPHMGWNTMKIRQEDPLFRDMYTEPRFYFVHSYYVDCTHNENVLAETVYGTPFNSVIGKGNIRGTQFHPEKSHKYGLRLLKNYSRI